MEMGYLIQRMPKDARAVALSGEFNPQNLPESYRSLSEAEIGHYAWGGDYRPPAFARVGWNDTGLFVLMYAFEEVIRSQVEDFGGAVCVDSCLEFFLMPNPLKDARYVNVEVTPKGVAHIGIGEGRGGRDVLSAPPAGFTVSHSAHSGKWWAIAYELSAEFLTGRFGDCLASGQEMRGNFYTCDESVHPHFGTHFPIKAEKPDFHRPECFGKMTLS